MRVLLSTIGSRGDVQPLVALAQRLRDDGHDPRFCVPPDFRVAIEALGFAVTPIGPELQRMGAARPASPPPPDLLRRMADATVATQFTTITEAARGCDVIVAATALQIGAHSVAEALGIPYVFTAYSPAVLPSPHHAPPPSGSPPPDDEATDTSTSWASDAERFTTMFGPALNAQRSAIGLPAVDDVRAHVLTGRPWLAADATLAPWPGGDDVEVFQPGAWIAPDPRPLPPEVEAFLDAGEPPVYFGFGSIRVSPDTADAALAAARAVGRRAIVSRGWADLRLAGDAVDGLQVGEVNHQALFERVAVVVHHGGAGTTTVAARAGAPQVLVPQVYDQHDWARRIQALGVGIAHAPGTPTGPSLAEAVGRALDPPVVGRAADLAGSVGADGAAAAAARLSLATRTRSQA